MQNTNLTENLTEISKLVDPIINQLLSDNVEEYTSEVALYQCGVGGKRIRPALVVLSGQMFGADVNDLLNPAASVEILHNSTLIIDDIIDHSEFRRDQLTCWNKFGQSIAECTAFVYLASVFKGLSHANNGAKLIDLYSNTLKVVIDGEIKDILFERFGRDNEDFVVKNRYENISKDDYFKMIGQKTAVLLKTCCQAGALVANASDEQYATIGDFGFNLGLAFQIRDDILDIFGDEKEFGKKIGKDIIEKKMGNFVILTAIEKLDSADKETVCRLLQSNQPISDDDLALITSLIGKTDAKKVAEETASYFVQNAFTHLEKLPQNEYRDGLHEVAEYVIGRNK